MKVQGISDSLDGPGCGVATHGDDCLCDVHYTQASAIRITQLADLPYVEGVARRLHVGVPWTDHDLESVMRIVLHAHDMRQDRELAPKWEPYQPVNKPRQEVLELHAQGHDIDTVMSMLDITFVQWRKRFLPSHQNPLWRLGHEQWLALEADIKACTKPVTMLAAESDCSRRTMTDAIHWLGLTRYVKKQQDESRSAHRLSLEEREAIRQMIRDGFSPSEIKQAMWERYGAEISASLVSHTRNRMTKKGDL